MRILAPAVLVSLLATVAAAPAAPAATDLFLQAPGIRGESQDARHADWIDVDSYSWGASANARRTRLGALTIAKRLDASSPRFFERLVTGTLLPSIELEAQRSGDAQLVYLRLCFEDVQVSSIDQSGAEGASSPAESLVFNYAKLSQQYTAQDPRGGAGQTVFAGWDATAGQLISTYPAACGN